MLAAGCGSGLSSHAAAKVGDTEVQKSRVDALLAQAKAQYTGRSRPFPAPGSPPYQAFRERATGFLVVGAMYEDKAKHEGITVGDDDVSTELAHKLRAYGRTPAQQEKQLKAQGLTKEELRAETRQELIQRRVQQKIFARVKVSDADVRTYYARNKSRYASPATRDVRMILVRSKQLANRIAIQLHSGADFGELVRKYSEDPTTKPRGGRLTIVKGQASPDTDRTVFALRTGQISAPLTSPDGATRIFQALEPTHPAKATPLSAIADTIRREVLARKQQQALAAWQLEAKREYCGGDKITYAKGYKPLPDSNPCGRNRITPAEAS